ncbi:aminoglycoside N(3)-acetyltransferase [Paenibacillus septentrionalis]|uniref:Aminoglycoside N(3)-acetyltransferase n=1 Tax=Paenibacillus septentrionalis TaxID=429342 RepID=A0ABW1V366_9BACL
MSEHKVIEGTRRPITVQAMLQDLKNLGICEGDTILVHSALSSLGWVCGGPQAAVQALLQAVGESGTLVMPAQSADWSDPAEWENPPVPTEWIDIIYREMPAFDPAITPTRGMGRIAELFRTFPGTVRSDHPQASFCANGLHAEYITSGHELTPQFGMASPLGKLYDLQAKVLLLGVGYDSCTSFHLAEAQIDSMPKKRMGAAVLENGQRVWRWFEDFQYDSEDFARIGEQLETESSVMVGKVGNAECKLFHMKDAVDFAKQWLQSNRIGL